MWNAPEKSQETEIWKPIDQTIVIQILTAVYWITKFCTEPRLHMGVDCSIFRSAPKCSVAIIFYIISGTKNPRAVFSGEAPDYQITIDFS